MSEIPTKYLMALIIIGVVVGYYLIGEIAFTGLLALLFGIKGKGKEADDAFTEAKLHRNLGELHKKKAQEKQNEANEIHDEIINIAEDITDPKTLPDSKRKRTDIKFG